MKAMLSGGPFDGKTIELVTNTAPDAIDIAWWAAPDPLNATCPARQVRYARIGAEPGAEGLRAIVLLYQFQEEPP